jgi:hypothetical protein
MVPALMFAACVPPNALDPLDVSTQVAVNCALVFIAAKNIPAANRNILKKCWLKYFFELI